MKLRIQGWILDGAIYIAVMSLVSLAYTITERVVS